MENKGHGPKRDPSKALKIETNEVNYCIGLCIILLIFLQFDILSTIAPR